MGVSPHTVDERVRRSLKKLNTSNRIEAAKLLASNGVFDRVTPYQSLRYQLADLGGEPPVADAETGRRSRRGVFDIGFPFRSEEHTSELQSLMRISYAVFCLKKKTHYKDNTTVHRSLYNTHHTITPHIYNTLH